MTGLLLALLVALGGGIGAAARHGVDLLVPARRTFPWALLLVNVSGSFALGVLVAVSDQGTWSTVLGTGVLGGYTTFSSASADAARRWVDGERAAGLVCATAMAVACIAAAVAGSVALSP